ncbi:MAG: hypothetical protein JSS32_07885 [Verrucomicrobia bacterium]|nr:hypothetical protein [Verrucomicrobiota bacterium]
MIRSVCSGIDCTNFFTSVEQKASALKERAITQLTLGETELDRLMPNFWIQDKIDYFLQEIDRTFNTPNFDRFREQLSTVGQGKWYMELAMFLAKLPLKAGLNILNMLKNLLHMAVKGAVYLVAHPLKAPMELAKKILAIAYELAQPQTWVRVGSNLIGSGLGYSLVTPNPFSPIVLAIGTAMVLMGVTMKAVRAALEKQNPAAVGEVLMEQGRIVAEDVTTGFCLGMLMGGIQQAVRGIQQTSRNCAYQSELDQLRREAIRNQTREFMDANQMPAYDRISESSNSVGIYYNPAKGPFLPKQVPNAQIVFKEFVTDYHVIRTLDHIKVEIIDGVTVSTPVYQTTYIPIYTEMVGYQFPLNPWPIPAPPPQVPPVANVFHEAIVPTTLAYNKV